MRDLREAAERGQLQDARKKLREFALRFHPDRFSHLDPGTQAQLTTLLKEANRVYSATSSLKVRDSDKVVEAESRVNELLEKFRKMEARMAHLTAQLEQAREEISRLTKFKKAAIIITGVLVVAGVLIGIWYFIKRRGRKKKERQQMIRLHRLGRLR